MDEYTVTYDPDTDEYTATRCQRSCTGYESASGHLAYLWLAQQIADSDDES
jgi:hypothetical protein